VHFAGGSFGLSYRLGSSISKQRFDNLATATTHVGYRTVTTAEIKDNEDSLRDDMIEDHRIPKKKSVKIKTRPPR
jgi:hypothetical protein